LSVKYRLRAFWIDAWNRLRFGADAPRYAERIWIDPSQCRKYIEAKDLARDFCASARQMSGRVVRTWPAFLEQELDQHPKLGYCWSHWREGKSWQHSGAIDFMLGQIAVSKTGITDDCCTLEDVIQRFNKLDEIWSEVQLRGLLPPRKELDPGNFREVGGVLMHLGPGGEPFFSGAGCHRFALALMLEVPFPAQIGIVHRSAIKCLPQLRLRPDTGTNL
jgi:hypothetical protein